MASRNPSGSESLAKRLKKCKTRKERQNAMLLDQIEREERRRAEEAAIAVLKQRELEEHQAHVQKELDEMFRKEDPSTRPKTPRTPKQRKERAEIKKPTPEKPKFNYARRFGFDPKKVIINEAPHGKIAYTLVDTLPICPFVVENNQLVESETFKLWKDLQKLNLRSPEIKEKIRLACAKKPKDQDKPDLE